ncbi:MAG: hypothetical protein NUW08_03205 [Candidatus Uhrbacteria bacterium]|nr:hypothetical protein [Candidatus Uhrbacteria bacterium]
MASISSNTDGEITEFKGRLARAGFSAEIVREVNTCDDNELAKVMYEALMRHPRFTLVHGLFTTTEKQVARVREWNKEFGWGIPDVELAEAEKSVPAWPEEKLVAVVLVPYLADKASEDETVTSGLERTFHELWMRAKAEQDADWRWDGYDKADSNRLRLLSGIEHKVGLRWEVIDLGSQRNKKPMDVRSSKSSPNAGILAAAALHPNWVKSTDGDKVPYVWIPGYEVQVPGGRPWADVPGLGFGRGNHGIQLDYDWCGCCDSRWAVPSFFRE